jgi:hypothetical protein
MSLALCSVNRHWYFEMILIPNLGTAVMKLESYKSHVCVGKTRCCVCIKLSIQPLKEVEVRDCNVTGEWKAM